MSFINFKHDSSKKVLKIEEKPHISAKLYHLEKMPVQYLYTQAK